MNKAYQYKFNKQGADVALVAISKRKLSKTAQCKILTDYLTPRREARLAKATGKIVIYNDAKRSSSNDTRRVR